MVISSSLSQQIFQALPRSLGPFFTSSTQPSCPLAMNDKPPTRTHIYSKLNGNFFVPGIGRPIDLPRIDNVPPGLPKYKIFLFLQKWSLLPTMATMVRLLLNCWGKKRFVWFWWLYYVETILYIASQPFDILNIRLASVTCLLMGNLDLLCDLNI